VGELRNCYVVYTGNSGNTLESDLLKHLPKHLLKSLCKSLFKNSAFLRAYFKFGARVVGHRLRRDMAARHAGGDDLQNRLCPCGEI